MMSSITPLSAPPSKISSPSTYIAEMDAWLAQLPGLVDEINAFSFDAPQFGSASAPAFTFDGDSDTGIFRASGNSIGFSCGGSEAARFDASGRFLIGATTADSITHFEGSGVIADMNRTGSFGTVLRLQKDGTDHLNFQANSNGATMVSSGILKVNVNGGVQALAIGTDKTISLEHVLELAELDVAGLPAASAHTGGAVYCSDGDAGSPCLAVSDGSSWRRITLGTAVSAT